MKRTVVLALLILVVAAILSPVQASYVVTDIGDLISPMHTRSYAYSINNKGDIVGTVYVEPNSGNPFGSRDRAYLFNDQLGMHELGTLPNGVYSNARSINDNGQVVGWASTEFGLWKAFFWDKSSGMRVISTSPYSSWAYAINNNGQVVGHQEIIPSAVQYAFVWDSATGLHDLLPGAGTVSYGYGINNAGNVVGQSGAYAHSPSACCWIDGKWIGMQANWASDINDSGTIVGNLASRAYVWGSNLDQTLHLLELAQGSTDSNATCINNHGQVVGNQTVNGKQRACMWSPSGVELLPLPSGSTCAMATSINEIGQIVGYGDSAVSSDRALIWCPDAGVKSIGACNQLPAFVQVTLESVVVTATGLEPGIVFVEDAARSAGLKIETTNALTLGDRITCAGLLRHTNGESALRNATIISKTAGEELSPLGITTQALCNDRTESLDYTGLNTTGLLVRFAGKVVLKSTADHLIYVDDGGNFTDGLSPYFHGVRVQLPSDVASPDKGRMVIITGISRVQKYTLPDGGGEVNGDWKPAGTTVYVPSVWVRNSSDIRIIK